MEKSIESIWKKGFMDPQALIAPKLNKLYTKKSIHIIDKFKRMFRLNLILIVIGSMVILGMSFIVGLPYMGVPMFFAMNALVLVNKKLLNSLERVNKGENSYDYLTAFDEWIKYQISINKKFSRFFYPFVFLSLVAGFWMKQSGELTLGQQIVDKLLLSYPDLQLIYGVPVIGVCCVASVVVLLYVLGGKIYEWDLKIVYGRILKKLDEILKDIKELKE
mgnify:CR=1 FL=1